MGIFITTNQNVQIEYRVSSIMSRFLACLLDYAVITGLMIALFYIGNLIDAEVLMLIGLSPIFFYHLICEMTMDGQSVGKRVLNIKVMKTDGRDASFSSYLLRFLIRPVDMMFAIGLVAVFFTKKGQRLGDLAAGTMIVDAPKNISIRDISTADKASAPAKITFPEAAQLKDTDIGLIKTVLEKRKSEMRHQTVLVLADKIQQVLGVTTELRPYAFLETIVNDFNTIHG